MAVIANGTTVYWTSGGETLTGTVVYGPTLLASGLPNQGGGEARYQIKSVTGTGAPASSTAQVSVLATEVRTSP